MITDNKFSLKLTYVIFIMEEYMGEVIRGNIDTVYRGFNLGALRTVFIEKMMDKMVQRALTGFAAGIYGFPRSWWACLYRQWIMQRKWEVCICTGGY